MQSPKQYLWKWQIGLMILVAWIGCGGRARITPPSPQSGEMMVSSDDMQPTDETTVDIGTSLVEIAQRASRESTKQMVDLVFVIDGRLVGKEPEKIQRWLADMASVFDASTIDYRASFIWFRGGASQMRGKPLEKGLTIFEEGSGKSPLRFKGVVARDGLDAIMTGITELEFRWNAEKQHYRDSEKHVWEDKKRVWDGEKHFVLMTSEALKTDWGAGRESELVEKILDRCRENEIRIHIIGISEEIQIQLAYLSGGEWYEAPENLRKDEQVLADIFMPFIPKVDEIFRRIAQHIAETVQQPVDLVFLLDSSLSMNNKVDKICTGLDTLVQVLDSEGLDYRLGVIRFWAVGGSGSSVLTTKPPLSAEQVKKLFRRPRRGNEHLLDAIIRGVSKLQTPTNRKLVLIIVTDEPASSGPGTGYTYTGAIETCRHLGAQVNIIGGVRPLASRSGMFVEADKFQRLIIEATNGTGYIMPGVVPHWRDRFSR